MRGLVLQIMFENNKVVGLDILKDGQLHHLKVNKELILSAGAIESPKILMLSGVGPSDHLEKLHIPVQANLPVGDNLQDHPMCVLEYLLKKPQTIDVDRSYTDNASTKDMQQYLFYTKGSFIALRFYRFCYLIGF